MSVLLRDNKFYVEDKLESLEKILNSLNASVQLLRADELGNFEPIWTNEKFKEILGFSVDERHQMEIDKKVSELFHPDELGIIRNKIKEIVNGSCDEVNGMLRLKTKKGERKWVFTSTRQIEIDNESNYLLTIMVDLTKDMNNEYLVRQEYVKEINQLKNTIKINKLTKAEKEIIAKLVAGNNCREIAQERERSFETINNNKRNVFKKLDIHKISELVCFAIENGLNQ